MSKTSIYAAKININENIFCQDYQKMIPWIGKAVLNHNKIEYEEKDTKWVFIDTKEINLDGNIYIVGNLSKVLREKNETKYERNKGLFVETNENIAYISSFLLDIDSEIIVFEPVPGLSKNDFLEYFSKLCNRVNCEIGELKLKLYPRSQEIEEIIKNIEKVYWVEFKIIPANYRSNKGFLKLDEIMKDDGVDELQQKLKNKNGNMSIEKGSLFDQSMQMVKRAYGTFSIKYLRKDTKKQAKTDSEKTVYTKKIDKKDKTKEEVINEFKTLIEKVKIDNDL